MNTLLMRRHSPYKVNTMGVKIGRLHLNIYLFILNRTSDFFSDVKPCINFLDLVADIFFLRTLLIPELIQKQ